MMLEFRGVIWVYVILVRNKKNMFFSLKRIFANKLIITDYWIRKILFNY